MGSHPKSSRAKNSRPSNSRQANERRGRRAEQWAVIILWLKGYRIIATRYKTPFGEADIIAAPRFRRPKILAVVEVKQRQTLQLAHDSLRTSTIRRIEEAGVYFVQNNPRYTQFAVRYDAVFVLPRRLAGLVLARSLGGRAVHIKDAWRRY